MACDLSVYLRVLRCISARSRFLCAGVLIFTSTAGTGTSEKEQTLFTEILFSFLKNVDENVMIKQSFNKNLLEAAACSPAGALPLPRSRCWAELPSQQAELLRLPLLQLLWLSAPPLCVWISAGGGCASAGRPPAGWRSAEAPGRPLNTSHALPLEFPPVTEPIQTSDRNIESLLRSC